MTSETPNPAKTVMTVFMLVKTRRSWLSMPPAERFARMRSLFDPLFARFGDRIGLRFFDVEFYDARVTDLLMWDVRDHHAWELLVERLRETPFWDEWFEIIDILPSIENAYADNYAEEPIGVTA